MKNTVRKTKARQGKPRRAAGSGRLLNLHLHPDAAGIDVGAKEFVAALPPGRAENPVATFRTFTSGVHALRDWLLEHGIKTVAIESTGNYWITLYDTLVDAGLDVCLVNAGHVKGVPGKKTDVLDAVWLQQLHAAGLLRKSFRPAAEIVPLRYLMRHRADLVSQASEQVNLMQKTLTEMNLKLQQVFSDIDGQSVQAIIDAILAGERDPRRLAALRSDRCRAPLAEVLEALRGDYRPEYLFVLRQSQTQWRNLQQAVEQCDREMGALSAKVDRAASGPLPPAPAKQRQRRKNSPGYAIHEEAWRFYGTDLGAVDGVSAGLLSVLMSETGTREQLLKAFPAAARFCSWLGLCPDNRVSGGKVLKTKTRPVRARLAKAFRLAVYGLQKSETEMGRYFRRMKSRLGKAEGTTAAAHKLARIVYALIEKQCPYSEKEAFAPSQQTAARRLRMLQKQAQTLGYELTPAAIAA
jgi:transposase